MLDGIDVQTSNHSVTVGPVTGLTDATRMTVQTSNAQALLRVSDSWGGPFLVNVRCTSALQNLIPMADSTFTVMSRELLRL